MSKTIPTNYKSPKIKKREELNKLSDKMLKEFDEAQEMIEPFLEAIGLSGLIGHIKPYGKEQK